MTTEGSDMDELDIILNWGGFPSRKEFCDYYGVSLSEVSQWGGTPPGWVWSAVHDRAVKIRLLDKVPSRSLAPGRTTIKR